MIRLQEPLQLEPLTTAQLQQLQKQRALIVDTRAAEQFASFHIPGAMQIGLMGPFAGWAAVLIKPTQKILLIVEEPDRAHEAQNRLARVGLRNVIGYALADDHQWRQQGIALTSVHIRQCEDVCLAMQEGCPFQLVDVRSSAEWLNGHLPGAISRPLLELNSKAASIDFSKPSLVYCQEEYRAMTAASMLLRRNAGDIGVLIEGFAGWQACGLPVETSEERERPFFPAFGWLPAK